MKALVVRVNNAGVKVEDNTISSIDKGLALFVGLERGDGDNALTAMAQRIANLRIFENEAGKMHYSVKDKSYPILCVSNFTLCANTTKGRRPSFEDSMPPEDANKLFNDFVLILKSYGIDVRTGKFGAHMDIQLDLDGPVNIMLNTKER